VPVLGVISEAVHNDLQAAGLDEHLLTASRLANSCPRLALRSDAPRAVAR
jgi:hypothetical protein